MSNALPHPSPARPGLGSACEGSALDLTLTRDVLEGVPGSGERLLVRLRCLARFLSAINLRAGSPLDAHELSDLVQDTLIVIWRKLDHFVGPDGLEPWALRIARYEFLNSVRSKARRQALVRVMEDGPALAASGNAAEEELNRQTLAQVLRELDPRMSETIHLKIFRDLTFDEIAERMDCSANTAKTRYYRGLMRLSGALESSQP